MAEKGKVDYRLKARKLRAKVKKLKAELALAQAKIAKLEKVELALAQVKIAKLEKAESDRGWRDDQNRTELERLRYIESDGFSHG